MTWYCIKSYRIIRNQVNQVLPYQLCEKCANIYHRNRIAQNACRFICTQRSDVTPVYQ